VRKEKIADCKNDLSNFLANIIHPIIIFYFFQMLFEF